MSTAAPFYKATQPFKNGVVKASKGLKAAFNKVTGITALRTNGLKFGPGEAIPTGLSAIVSAYAGLFGTIAAYGSSTIVTAPIVLSVFAATFAAAAAGSAATARITSHYKINKHKDQQKKTQKTATPG